MPRSLVEEVDMGMYREQVLPRIINVACGLKMVEPLRRRTCEGLYGEVIELGFGSGLNIPFYPGEVTAVTAIEPSAVGWNLAGKTSGRGRCSHSAGRPGRPIVAVT